jgi:transcriptional regulator with XRE-family HTH domain
MDVNEKIRELMQSRHWSEYRLAQEAGLSQSTIANLFKRNTVPSIATLELICKGFGITLSQFFAQGPLVDLSEEQQNLLSNWLRLPEKQRKIFYDLLLVMCDD